jgi:hypothetical protein
MNKSARVAAGLLKAFLPREGQAPQSASLGADFIEKPRLSWWAPTVSKCSTPVDCEVEELLKQLDRFLNPEVAEQEVADEEEDR